MVQPSDRDLTAIVSLDLHGYSRLTEQDEIGTHRALMGCWRDHLTPIAGDRRGVVVKWTGDGALVRFPSAPQAVEAMIRFQQDVASAESCFPRSRRLVFRVGIHLAPTIQEGDDVFGHGVNLAVRLQEVAQPGSICLSDAVMGRLDPERRPPLDALGRVKLKNIEERVAVHRWRPDAEASSASRPRAASLMAGLLLMGLVMPKAAWQQTEPVPQAIVASAEPATASALPAAAIEAKHGLLAIGEAWVEPYRGLSAGPLGSEIKTTMAAAERALESRSEIAEDAYLQALALYGRDTPEALAQAIGELDQALRLEADYPAAHALLAAVYWGGLRNRWQLGRGLTASDMLSRVEHHLAEVTAPQPIAHMVASEMLTASGRHEPALAQAEQALSLAPDDAVGHFARGRALLFAGRAAEGERAIRAAIRLDPDASRYLFGLALAQFSRERFDDARRTLARATRHRDGNDWPHLLMAATSGYLGRSEEASAALGRFDHLSVPRRGWFASQIPYVHSWPFQDRRDRERLHRGMVLAGIPALRR